jgi:hypothetical protein
MGVAASEFGVGFADVRQRVDVRDGSIEVSDRRIGTGSPSARTNERASGSQEIAGRRQEHVKRALSSLCIVTGTRADVPAITMGAVCTDNVPRTFIAERSVCL